MYHHKFSGKSCTIPQAVVNTHCGMHLQILHMAASTTTRQLAHHAWHACDGDLDSAIVLFKTLCKGDVPPQVKRFVLTWGPRESAKNKPGQGRQCKIQNDVAKKLANMYKSGFNTRAGDRGYTSVDHAKRMSSTFAQLIADAGNPSNKTVMRAMRRVDKNLGKVRQCAKKQLSPQNKSYRRKVAGILKRIGKKQLHAVTWVDEVSKWVKLPDRLVAGDKRKGDRIVDDYFASKNKKQQIKISALLAVNYAVGPLYCKLLTGTTGGIGTDYQVQTFSVRIQCQSLPE